MQHVISANFPELTASIKIYAISYITTINTGTVSLMLLIWESERGLIEPPPRFWYRKYVCVCVCVWMCWFVWKRLSQILTWSHNESQLCSFKVRRRKECGGAEAEQRWNFMSLLRGSSTQLPAKEFILMTYWFTVGAAPFDFSIRENGHACLFTALEQTKRLWRCLLPVHWAEGNKTRRRPVQIPTWRPAAPEYIHKNLDYIL